MTNTSHEQISDSRRRSLEKVAQKNGFSFEAILTLYAALLKSNGTMAQFSHAELGGMGQWSSGMLMIGEISNAQLKLRVEKAIDDVAQLLKNSSNSTDGNPSVGDNSGSLFPANTFEGSKWWPADLGAAASSGSQNDSHYAYFSGRHRLAIKHNGTVTIYDTGSHEISGVSQQQGDSKSLAFESQNGVVNVADLKVIP